MKIIFIVESPAKAKTITKYLREIDPENDYEVIATMGHIRDLKAKELSIDLDSGSFEPTYIVTKNISRLRNAVKDAAKVYVAADPDREGESIAWHVVKALRIPKNKYVRVTFNEISKSAIEAAITSPRPLDMDLVNAQQARRVIDRIAGFKISPLLWRRFPAKKGLSAGRVQSACLKLIVDKERSIEAFWKGEKEALWRVTMDAAITNTDDTKNTVTITAHLTHKKDGTILYDDIETARSFLESLEGTFFIESSRVSEKETPPPLPYTTSTLQQDAFSKLHMPIKVTMQLAQELYESGFITYMRTDSHQLSRDAVNLIAIYAGDKYGPSYVHKRRYKDANKGNNAQEAHEAIRPTSFSDSVEENVRNKLGERHARLFAIIMKRTVASQMKAAVHVHCHMTIKDSSMKKNSVTFEGSFSVLKSEGWMVVYGQTGSDCSWIEPTERLQLQCQRVCAMQVVSSPPARYTESSIVKTLDQKGIGRPSTYTSILAKLVEKDYVKADATMQGKAFDLRNLIWDPHTKKIEDEREQRVVGAEKGRLQSTDLGSKVCAFLESAFPDIVSETFTTHMELELDEIAQGNKAYDGVVGEFWKQLKTSLQSVTKGH